MFASTSSSPCHPVPAKPAASHLEFIDGLRALAALFVVFCHAYYEPEGGYYPERIMNHLGLIYGHIAVDVFIVVSGFCLMLPVARRGDQLGSVKAFRRRRALRILPPYYIALLLTCAYILTLGHDRTGTVWDQALPLSWQQFALYFAMLHDLPLNLPGGSINYAFWSIAVECQIYLVMPLIILSLRSANAGWTLAWTIGLGALIHFASHGRLDPACPWYLGMFTIGAVAARECVTSGGEMRPWWRPLSYLLGMIAAATILAKGKAFFDAHQLYLDTIIGIAAALMIAATYKDAEWKQSRMTRLLSWRPLATIGVMSYSLYLIHAPLLHLFDRMFTRILHPHEIPMFFLLVTSAPMIILVAYGFHMLFERPFMSAPKSVAKPTLAASGAP